MRLRLFLAISTTEDGTLDPHPDLVHQALGGEARVDPSAPELESWIEQAFSLR